MCCVILSAFKQHNGIAHKNAKTIENMKIGHNVQKGK